MKCGNNDRGTVFSDLVSELSDAIEICYSTVEDRFPTADEQILFSQYMECLKRYKAVLSRSNDDAESSSRGFNHSKANISNQNLVTRTTLNNSNQDEILFREARERLKTVKGSDLQKIQYPGIDVHVRSWSYPIPVRDCNESVSKFIILVPTAPKRFTSRTEVRSTWGNTQLMTEMKSRLIFVVGLTTDSQVQKQLEQESDKHQDILQVDMYDSYYNLSLKTIGMLNWVKDHCQSTAFVAKIDDDMMAGIPNIVKFAEKTIQSYDKFIAGSYRANGSPNPGGKWYDPIYKPAFNKKKYPVFLGGPGYIMSAAVVKELLANCYKSPFLHLEDVFVTGVCGEGILGLKRMAMTGYSMARIDGCLLARRTDFTLAHSYPVGTLVGVWNRWKNPQLCGHYR